MGVVGHAFGELGRAFMQFSEAVDNANKNMSRAVEELRKLPKRRRVKWVRCPWCGGTGVHKNRRCALCKGKCALRTKHVRKWWDEGLIAQYTEIVRSASVGFVAEGLGVPSALALDVCTVMRVPPALVYGVDAADAAFEPVRGAEVIDKLEDEIK